MTFDFLIINCQWKHLQLDPHLFKLLANSILQANQTDMTPTQINTTTFTQGPVSHFGATSGIDIPIYASV